MVVPAWLILLMNAATVLAEDSCPSFGANVAGCAVVGDALFQRERVVSSRVAAEAQDEAKTRDDSMVLKQHEDISKDPGMIERTRLTETLAEEIAENVQRSTMNGSVDLDEKKTSTQWWGRRRTPSPTPQGLSDLSTSRNDVSLPGKNIGSQLEGMKDVSPTIFKPCCGRDYFTWISGHVQGMARLSNGWASVSSYEEGYADGMVLGYATPTELKDGKYIDEKNIHVCGAAASGNVLAVFVGKDVVVDDSGRETRNQYIKFWDFSSGEAQEMPNLQIDNIKYDGPIGLTYVPSLNSFILFVVTSNKYHRVYVSRENTLFGSCTRGNCWDISFIHYGQGGYLYNPDHANTGMKHGVRNGEESGALIYDEAEAALYFFYFGRDGPVNNWRACKVDIHGARAFMPVHCYNQDLTHNLDSDGGQPIIEIGSWFAGAGISPNPSWRWGGTAFADPTGKLVLAASAREPERQVLQPTKFSWTVGLWINPDAI